MKLYFLKIVIFYKFTFKEEAMDIMKVELHKAKAKTHTYAFHLLWFINILVQKKLDLCQPAFMWFDLEKILPQLRPILNIFEDV